jgi:hypothetical protein
MSMWGKYEIVLRNSEIQLTKEENQKKNSVSWKNDEKKTKLNGK